MIVDSHAHVWTLDTVRYPWRPTFGLVPSVAAPPDELLRAMDRHQVRHAVLVQPSAYGRDHTFLLDTVSAYPTRFVAMGLVDPADEAGTTAAVRLVLEGWCAGLRINLSLDPDRASKQARAAGWRQLATLDVPLSIRATPAHRDLVLRILDAHRATRIVIDHLGLPERGLWPQAEALLVEFARFDQCWLKIAGLATLSEEGPPFRDTWPLVRAAIRAFGSARLVWGSDFPAGEASHGYGAAIEAIDSMPFLTATDRDRVMSLSSRELWGEPRRPRTTNG